MVTYKKLNDKQKYSRWYNMNSRCYRECYHRSHPGTIYPECSVCDAWRTNKESFYDWLDKEYYTISGEQMDIDKDILRKGNRLYSPETCLVVPHTINVLWAMLPASYPTFNEERQQWEADAEFFPTPYSQKKYFDDLEEARDYMAGIKYAHIKEVAELYKDEMPEKIYPLMFIIFWRYHPHHRIIFPVFFHHIFCFEPKPMFYKIFPYFLYLRLRL